MHNDSVIFSAFFCHTFRFLASFFPHFQKFIYVFTNSPPFFRVVFFVSSVIFSVVLGIFSWFSNFPYVFFRFPLVLGYDFVCHRLLIILSQIPFTSVIFSAFFCHFFRFFRLKPLILKGLRASKIK